MAGFAAAEVAGRVLDDLHHRSEFVVSMLSVPTPLPAPRDVTSDSMPLLAPCDSTPLPAPHDAPSLLVPRDAPPLLTPCNATSMQVGSMPSVPTPRDSTPLVAPCDSTPPPAPHDAPSLLAPCDSTPLLAPCDSALPTQLDPTVWVQNLTTQLKVEAVIAMEVAIEEAANRKRITNLLANLRKAQERSLPTLSVPPLFIYFAETQNYVSSMGGKVEKLFPDWSMTSYMKDLIRYVSTAARLHLLQQLQTDEHEKDSGDRLIQQASKLSNELDIAIFWLSAADVYDSLTPAFKFLETATKLKRSDIIDKIKPKLVGGELPQCYAQGVLFQLVANNGASLLTVEERERYGAFLLSFLSIFHFLCSRTTAKATTRLCARLRQSLHVSKGVPKRSIIYDASAKRTIRISCLQGACGTAMVERKF